MDAQSTADQRKKSKQEYLEALSKQKSNSNGSVSIPSSTQPTASGNSFSMPANAPSTNPSSTAGLTKREQLLEEKRRAFFEGKSQAAAPAANNDIFRNNESSMIPSNSTKTESKGLFAPSSNILDAPPQAAKPPGPKPTAADIDNGTYKLSDWKKFGYPSEFAFAKDIGLLNDKPKQKPTVDSTATAANPVGAQGLGFGNMPSNNQFHFNTNPSNNSGNPQLSSFPQYPTYNGSNDPNTMPTNSAYNPIPSLAFGNIPTNIEAAPTSTRPGYAPSSIPNSLLGNRPSTAERKKQQQEQYAKQLNQQIQQQNANILPTNTPNPFQSVGQQATNPGGNNGGWNIGGHGDNDKDMKRAKQEEYARQLQQQQQQMYQPQSFPTPNSSNMTSGPSYGDYGAGQDNKNMAGGGGLNIGNVLDKDTKKAKQAEYARQLQQQQQQMHQNQPSFPSSSSLSAYQSAANSHQSSPDAVLIGGGGLNIGSVSDKDAKKAKQAEYARQLQQQQQQFAQPPQMPTNNHQNVQYNQNNSYMDNNFGNNNNNSYGNYPPSNNAVQSNPMAGGGGLNIGSVLDKDAKKAKQAEYARQLQQQQQQHSQSTAQSQNSNNNHHHNNNFNNNQFNNAGNYPSNNLNQNNYGNNNPYGDNNINNYGNYPPSNTNIAQSNPMAGGGGLNIGSVLDKDAKKAKQAEYARQLQQQQQQQQKVSEKQQSSSSAGGSDAGYGYNSQAPSNMMGYGNNNGGNGGYTPSGPGQQNMYGQFTPNNALQIDPMNGMHGGYGGGFMGGNPSMQNNNPGAAAAGGFQIGNDPLNEKEKKKLQQQEYANALKQQMQVKGGNAPSVHQPNRGNDTNNHAQSNASNAAGALDAGWEIGPLGVPVRKTLNVGNRGVQKAYNNYVVQQTSPSKVPSSSGFGGGGGAGLFSPNGGGGGGSGAMNNMNGGMGGYGAMNGNPSNQMYGNMNGYNNNNSMWNPNTPQYGMNQLGNNMFPGGMPAGAPQIPGVPANILTDFDPSSEEKKRQAKAMEQARLLEEQIRIDKQRREEEKRKVEEKEFLEQQRIERDRQELAKAYEKEQLQLKQKQQEEQLKNELAKQMENKTKAKEDDKRKQEEENAREEARLAKERQEIARREEMERQRDLKIPTSQQQQQQQQQAFPGAAGANNKPKIPNLWGDNSGDGMSAGNMKNNGSGSSLGALLSGNSRPSTGNGMASAGRQKTPQIYPSNEQDDQPIVTKFARPNRNANLFQQNTIDDSDTMVNQRPSSVSGTNQQRKANLFDPAPSLSFNHNQDISNRGLFENANSTPSRRRSKLSYNGNNVVQQQQQVDNNFAAEDSSPPRNAKSKANLFDPHQQYEQQLPVASNVRNAPRQMMYEEEDEELPVVPSYSTHHNIPPVHNFPTNAALNAANKVQPNTKIYSIREGNAYEDEEEGDSGYQVVSMQGNRNPVKPVARPTNGRQCASVISANNKQNPIDYHYTVDQRGSEFDSTGDLARTLQSDSVFVLPDGRIFTNTTKESKSTGNLHLDTNEDMLKSPAKKSLRSPARPASTTSSAISSVSSSFQSHLSAGNNKESYGFREQEKATEEDILQQYEKMFPTSRPGTSNSQSGSNEQFDIDRELRKNQRKWSLLQKLQDIQGQDASINFTEMWNKEPLSTRGGGDGGKGGLDDGRSVWSRGDALNASNRPSSAASRPSSSSSLSRPTSSSNIVRHAGLFAVNGKSNHSNGRRIDDEELYNEYGL